MCKPIRAAAVVGPTASGKTALAIHLARRFATDVIGCDSMQIYRELEIGTAKPTKQERAAAHHRMIDFLDPALSYSAADYASDARREVLALTEAKRLPLFCGGTGLYLEAVRTGRHTEQPATDPALREALTREAAERGSAAMHEELRRIDPEAAAAIHPNNLRRVLRAIEIHRATGRTKSDRDAESRALPPFLELTVLSLVPADREALHRRIDRRVRAMVSEGLFEEVEGLLARGYLDPATTAGQAIGYKEAAAAIRGECTREAAIEQICYATHRYARRQLTWFRAIPGAIELSVPEGGLTEADCRRIGDTLASCLHLG